MKERDEQLENVKKEKNKYFKILEEKYEYIEQLEEGLKIQANEANVLKENQENLE